MAKILIVDDDPKVLKLLESLLRADGHAPIPAGDGATALCLLEEHAVELMISDIRMAPMDGIELFRRVSARWPHLPVIMLTAYGAVETAQVALRNGAFDYLTKPFRVNELVLTVKRALAEATKKAELAGQRDTEVSRRMLDMIVAESEAMRAVCEQVRRVAPTDASVLLTGESGTGKELLAKVLHCNSRRRDKPFLTLNCASFTAKELEYELFGRVENSASESPSDRRGLFAAAQGGTLFLDEVSCVSPAVQEKLLRVLRDRAMCPIGGTAPVPVNVRVLAASDVDLEEQIRAGTFIQDLYLRLAVIVLTIPPLRERPEDILPMVQFFLRKGGQPGAPCPRIPHDVANVLTRHPWPGNVRELGNAIQHALTFMPEGEVTMDSLPSRIVAQGTDDAASSLAAGAGRQRHVFLRAFLEQKQQEAALQSRAAPAGAAPPASAK
ncbi:MAG: sigma-54 dependent transcriptional regulator [bacterium]